MDTERGFRMDMTSEDWDKLAHLAQRARYDSSTNSDDAVVFRDVAMYSSRKSEDLS